MSQLNGKIAYKKAEVEAAHAGDCVPYEFKTKGIMKCCETIRKYKIKNDCGRNPFRCKIK